MARTEAAPPAPRLARPDARIAAVVAGFHRALSERLLAGTRERLAEAGLADGNLDVHWVPGAYELPFAAREVARRGRHAAVIAIGVVIRGETPHFDHICHAAATGLQAVALETGVPCTFGVLTVETHAQAEARAGGAVGNAGADAADAAVALANLVATP
ncbi:MAG: 6,7-dimethyl-8-ribityllumazine synthase [Thermoleophilia bacterium]